MRRIQTTIRDGVTLKRLCLELGSECQMVINFDATSEKF